MTNRLFPRPTSNFTNLNSEQPFNFDPEQHNTLAADLDRQMLELEKRYAIKTCAPPILQERIGAADVEYESCTFDDFGLVHGLEIDVSWM